MYENDFDSFVSQVLGGNNGLPVKSASQDQPAPQAMFSADQAEAAARAALSAEEAQMAEYLGQLEAENTVKQANFLQGLGGQQMNYGEYLTQLQYEQEKSAGMSEIWGALKGHGAAGLEKLKGAGAAVSEYAKAKGGLIHEGADKLGTGIRNRLPESVGEKILSTGSNGDAALGYGAVGLAGLGAIGLGLGARKIYRGHREAKLLAAMERAKAEQSIGAKVLKHLSKNKLGYGLGAAGLAGLGALGAYKSASMDEMLWEKAASDGEAFLDQLASAALGDATTQELALFREAALSHINGY